MRAEFVIAAHDVLVDRDTGLPSFISVFNQVRGAQFPMPVPPFAIICRLASEPGEPRAAPWRSR